MHNYEMLRALANDRIAEMRREAAEGRKRRKR
jgi:hypothetical protein